MSTSRLMDLGTTATGLAVIALLFVVSQMYVFHFDWTHQQRKTLSEGSQEILGRLDGPVRIEAFVRDNDLTGRRMIATLLHRYQRFKPDLKLEFVNPDRQPDRTRDLGITAPREMLVSYAGNSEKLVGATEQRLSNLLLRLTRRGEDRIQFLTGHGERSITGSANYELGEYGKVLEQKGYRVETLNLAGNPSPAEVRGLLVLASAETDLSPRELEFLLEFLALGGNLLWILDPKHPPSLAPLATYLGVTVLEGTVVDAGSRLYGIEDPAFAVVSRFPDHQITTGLERVALFPRAVGLDLETTDRWNATPLLSTQEESWTETGRLEGRIRYDEDSGERAGPIVLGAVLSRSRADAQREQRVAILGDGDFLSNSFLANGSNLELGLRLMTWLTSSDAQVGVEIRPAPDAHLEMSNTQVLTLAAWFLLAQPLITMSLGLAIWWRRRRR